MGFASWLGLYFAQSEVQYLVHKVMLEKKAVTRIDEMKDKEKWWVVLTSFIYAGLASQFQFAVL